MKVEGPHKTGSTEKTKKKGGASGTSGTFSDFIAAGPQKPAATSGGQAIVHVDALLALQGAEDPTARAAKKRMRMRADTILHKLDGLRMAMLSGNMTVGHMVGIADVVAAHREHITDPVLTGIMDEIDLRAQVELAKMRISLDG